MPDARLLHKYFDYVPGSREIDENQVECTSTMACKVCGVWRDQDSEISSVEARAWKHLLDDHADLVE